MSNVIQFPTKTITVDGYEMDTDSVKIDMVADLFKASFAAELCGDELGMNDYDIDCLSHIYKKYADKWSHLLQDDV